MNRVNLYREQGQLAERLHEPLADIAGPGFHLIIHPEKGEPFLFEPNGELPVVDLRLARYFALRGGSTVTITANLLHLGPFAGFTLFVRCHVKLLNPLKYHLDHLEYDRRLVWELNDRAGAIQAKIEGMDALVFDIASGSVTFKIDDRGRENNSQFDPLMAAIIDATIAQSPPHALSSAVESFRAGFPTKSWSEPTRLAALAPSRDDSTSEGMNWSAALDRAPRWLFALGGTGSGKSSITANQYALIS